MEYVEEDDGFSAFVMLATLKKERDVLKLDKEKVIQAKDEAGLKVEHLFQDKAELKLLYTEIKFELGKLKISLEDVKK